MTRAGVDVRERLVLDLGCSAGMMGQYLSLGARWVHGWDTEDATPHTQRLLWALGCTRFSLTPGGIVAGPPVESDVPSFLRPFLKGCVVSCLAVRGLGWLDALGRIPWSFVIWEGREGGRPSDLDGFVVELAKSTRVRATAAATYRDGGSRARPIAVIARAS
jgi:hypothetical protein